MRPDVDATTRTPTHLLCYAADDDLKPVWIKCAGLTGADALSDGAYNLTGRTRQLYGIQSQRCSQRAARRRRPKGRRAIRRCGTRLIWLTASVLLAQWVTVLPVDSSQSVGFSAGHILTVVMLVLFTAAPELMRRRDFNSFWSAVHMNMRVAASYMWFILCGICRVLHRPG